MTDLLSLKENQKINIQNEKYLVLNKIQYFEKSSFWYEYKIMKINDNKEYYLNVELSNKAILYYTISSIRTKN